MMPVTCFDKGCPRSGNFKIMFSVGFAYEASPGDENDTYWESGNDRRRCTRVKREAACLLASRSKYSTEAMYKW
jgi:hypothetical protein